MEKLSKIFFSIIWKPTLLFILLISLSKYVCKAQSFNGISSIRDLHRNCPGAGICYYFADDSDAGVKDSSIPCVIESNCAAIVSIQRFKPQDCDRNVQPPLNKVFCCEVETRGAELFQVTIGRQITEHKASCYIYAKNCITDEFVAIAFSEDTNLDAEPSPYFTCISKAAYVQSILQSATNASQLTFTTPYPRIATSIMWSHILDGDDGSLLCSFLISTREFHFMSTEKEVEYVNKTDRADRYNSSGIAEAEECNADVDEPMDPKYYKSFKFGKFGWKIKLARGRVQRNVDKNFSVEHVRINSKPENITAMHGGEESDMAKIWIVADPLENNNIPPLNDTKPPEDIPDPNEEHKEAMEKVHESCIERKSLCYLLHNERGCLHKQNCHLLVAITALDDEFDVLHFDIILQTKENGELRYVRPKGWGAWALSLDKKMDKDFVFTCSAIGHNTKVYPTLNIGRGNLYFKDQPYQDLMQNAEVMIWRREPELEHRVLCSFDIVTTFNVTNLPIENSQTSYDLKNKEYFVLMAQGTSVSDTWSISYHTVQNREVSDMKFSRKIYNLETSTAGRVTGMMAPWAWCIILFTLSQKYLHAYHTL